MRKTSLDCVYQLAKQDDRVVFIGSDLGPGVLDEMRTEFGERFFMEGVAEQHIIGMAAGMAMSGLIPYVNTIATFLTRRCFEQIAVDLCLQNLPVRLIANGGGLVYAPLGPTHLATEDISILRSLPNMTIVAVCDAEEMERLMKCTLDWPYPIYIRLGKGGDKVVSKASNGFQLGKAIKMRSGQHASIISTGVMTQVALEAASNIEKSKGINISVFHMHTIKPIDERAILEIAKSSPHIWTIEEHSRNGGLGTSVLEVISDNTPEMCRKVYRLGLPDAFPDKYGSQETLLDSYGLDSETLVREISSKIGDC